MFGTFSMADDFLRSLSNGAGYDVYSAIRELLDNSLGANATKIEISIKDGKFKISDNGEGMTEKILSKNFFCAGNSSTKNQKDAPGKFGIGGKTGILAIIGKKVSTDVMIETHKNGYSPIYGKWEITIGRSNRFEMNVGNDMQVPIGTTIEFEFENDIKINNVIRMIGVIYWPLIASNMVKFTVNNMEVYPSDPLYRNNKHVIENHIFKTKTINVLGEKIIINSTSFERGDIIPENERHNFDKGKGRSNSLSTAKQSGIYIMTAGRYYTLGENNFDKILGKVAHASLDGMRVEVHIPKKLWDKIGMTWNKGDKIKCFKQIPEFNEVIDYILSLTIDFTNGKKNNSEKSANKINGILDTMHQDGDISIIHTKVIAKNEEYFIKYNFVTKEIVFNVTYFSSIGQKELEGMIKSLAKTIDVIVKNDENSYLINEILKSFNNEQTI